MSAPQLAQASGGPTGRERRKQLGQWYTPLPLVEHLLQVATATGRPPRSVLDPACGDGRFLDAARAAFGPRVRLVGVDIDATAVAAAQVAVPNAEIRHADALTMDYAGEQFDLVVGNPPYLGQLASSTSRGGRSRFGGGPYADVAAEFLALAVDLAEPRGGRVALVLPQSILTTRDVGPIRAAIAERSVVRHAWWSHTAMFDAHVHVCGLVLELGGTKGPVTRTFGPEFAPRPDVTLDASWARLLVDRDHHGGGGGASANGTLGDHATFAVDFRDQYYGLVGAVADDADGPPLVTSGLIDPGICRWGSRPVRFAKQTFRAPRVDLTRLEPRLRRWAEVRLVPKVLVANQTRVIEAVVDRDGEWLPSVPVITCVPHDTAELDLVQAALSSAESTAWVIERAAGSGLSPTAVRLTPSLLAALPWPTDVPRTVVD